MVIERGGEIVIVIEGGRYSRGRERKSERLLIW